MKPLLLAVTLLGFVSSVSGSEEATFETAKASKIGESSAFELSKGNRAILKTGDHGYVVLDLLESSREDGDATFSDACSISWTLITPKSIQTDTASIFIRYRSEKTKEDSFTVN